jgi:hypothetical protein
MDVPCYDHEVVRWIGCSVVLLGWLGCADTPQQAAGSHDSGGSTTMMEGGETQQPAEASDVGEASSGISASGGSGDETTNDAVSTASTSDAPSTSSESGDDMIGSTSTGTALDCDAIFDGLPGYLLCDEDETTCTFSANLGQSHCTNMCAMVKGSVCMEQIDNPGGASCVEQGAAMQGCLTQQETDICVCTKP